VGRLLNEYLEREEVKNEIAALARRTPTVPTEAQLRAALAAAVPPVFDLLRALRPFITRPRLEYMTHDLSAPLPVPERDERLYRASSELRALFAVAAHADAPGLRSAPESPEIPVLGDLRLHRQEILEYEARRLLWALGHEEEERDDDEGEAPGDGTTLYVDWDWAQSDGLRDGDLRFALNVPMLEPAVESLEAELLYRGASDMAFEPMPVSLREGTRVVASDLAPEVRARHVFFLPCAFY